MSMATQPSTAGARPLGLHGITLAAPASPRLARAIGLEAIRREIVQAPAPRLGRRIAIPERMSDRALNVLRTVVEAGGAVSQARIAGLIGDGPTQPPPYSSLTYLRDLGLLTSVRGSLPGAPLALDWRATEAGRAYVLRARRVTDAELIAAVAEITRKAPGAKRAARWWGQAAPQQSDQPATPHSVSALIAHWPEGRITAAAAAPRLRALAEAGLLIHAAARRRGNPCACYWLASDATTGGESAC